MRQPYDYAEPAINFMLQLRSICPHLRERLVDDHSKGPLPKAKGSSVISHRSPKFLAKERVLFVVGGPT